MSETETVLICDKYRSMQEASHHRREGATQPATRLRPQLRARDRPQDQNHDATKTTTTTIITATTVTTTTK